MITDKPPSNSAASITKPILIIGAGISGLTLAQHLRKIGHPFKIFERDEDLTTRGIGWGLTLHWSLPPMRNLLPEEIVSRIPETYVDRVAVQNGACTRFPFFDLSTGELKAESPPAPESQRIRVTRGRLRELLATGIEIQWGKTFRNCKSNDDSVDVTFEDGSTYSGSLLVGGDGASSRVRKAVFPHPEMHQSCKIPVRMFGFRLDLTPTQMKPLLEIDPFFFQGTSSTNNTFIYVSLLDAPGNTAESTDKYSCQMCVSWPYREGFRGSIAPLEVPSSNESRHDLLQSFAETWADPFKTLALDLPADAEIKHLEPLDFPPPMTLRSSGRVVLMGDSLHAMAMYRGEGANHAIVDVADFAEHALPALAREAVDYLTFDSLRNALDNYEEAVIRRARPGVLASRRACLDAHDFSRVNASSPLLTRRAMFLDFDEE